MTKKRQMNGAGLGVSVVAPVARSVVIAGMADFGGSNSPDVGQCMYLNTKMT